MMRKWRLHLDSPDKQHCPKCNHDVDDYIQLEWRYYCFDCTAQAVADFLEDKVPMCT